MAQERHITPEKQLLKLIEDPKAKGPIIKEQTRKRQRRGLLSFSAWVSRINFLSDKLKRWFKSGEFSALDAKIINRVLSLAVLSLFVYFGATISVSLASLEKIPDLAVESKRDKESSMTQRTSLLKVASFYMEKVRKRNIFEIGYQPVEPPKELDESDKLPSQKTLEATRSLKLVGIAWSEDPDAMIEDTEAIRTFFVKRGDYIGEVKVEAIFKDKILLSYNGEEIELK